MPSILLACPHDNSYCKTQHRLNGFETKSFLQQLSMGPDFFRFLKSYKTHHVLRQQEKILSSGPKQESKKSALPKRNHTFLSPHPFGLYNIKRGDRKQESRSPDPKKQQNTRSKQHCTGAPGPNGSVMVLEYLWNDNYDSTYLCHELLSRLSGIFGCLPHHVPG